MKSATFVIALMVLAACSAPQRVAIIRCDGQSRCATATPAPTPSIDPANTYRDIEGKPATYLGTVDGCRIWRLTDYETTYVQRCPGELSKSTEYVLYGKAGHHPVQTL